jgi:hypothetical protein
VKTGDLSPVFAHLQVLSNINTGGYPNIWNPNTRSNNMLTNLVGWRTYIVAALMGIFGALAALDWNAVLDNPQAGIVAVFSAILMAIMRSVTNTPPGTPPSGK